MPQKKKTNKREKEEKAAESPEEGERSNAPYEDFHKIIDGELLKRKRNWFLSSVAWIDFDDVSQIIRAHIYKKWSHWDQSRPIKPWLNKIIANQMKNILRNHYSNYARPCLNCPFNNDAQMNLCSFTKSGNQDQTCPLYKKWEKTKKHAYNVKITLSLDSHLHEIDGNSDNHLDMDIQAASLKLIKELKSVLNDRQFKAFELLYIKNLSDEEVATQMGFKSTESGRKAGYKQIKNLRKILKEKAARILQKKGIAFLGDENQII
jgi:RNA polymerase sigma factor (sigma-70 family)